jgi:hypothetical protein
MSGPPQNPLADPLPVHGVPIPVPVGFFALLANQRRVEIAGRVAPAPPHRRQVMAAGRTKADRAELALCEPRGTQASCFGRFLVADVAVRYSHSPLSPGIKRHRHYAQHSLTPRPAPGGRRAGRGSDQSHAQRWSQGSAPVPRQGCRVPCNGVTRESAVNSAPPFRGPVERPAGP